MSLAGAADFAEVRGLIDAAAGWLRTKGTDQWAQAWPTPAARDRRIGDDLAAGKTWLARHGGELVATVTADDADDEGVWPPGLRGQAAVYLSRLVVDRRYAGREVGAHLIDWMGLRAARAGGARWVRVDVWTTNHDLHAYYRRQGFRFCGWCQTIVGYPSAALFQKPTDAISEAAAEMFKPLS